MMAEIMQDEKILELPMDFIHILLKSRENTEVLLQ
jgi:hypothetical protein